MCRFCATALVVEQQRIGPRNDRAAQAEPLQVGERRPEEQAAEAATAHRRRHAGRTEEAETAVVDVVRGEAGDGAVLFRDEERERLPVERSGDFEAPDTAELPLDELEDLLLFVGSRPPGSRPLFEAAERDFEVRRRHPFLESAALEEAARSRVRRRDSRDEVVARLGGHDRDPERLGIREEQRSETASPHRTVDDEEPQPLPARYRGRRNAPVELEDAQLRLARNPRFETFLLRYGAEVIRCIVRAREELAEAGEVVTRSGADHSRGSVTGSRRWECSAAPRRPAFRNGRDGMEGAIVRCAGCGKSNRLPVDPAGRQVVCGNCKTPLTAASSGRGVRVLTDASFDDVVRNGDHIVDFWAAWCGPCRVLAPVVEGLAAERNDVVFSKLNVDENPRTAGRFGVQGIPLLLFVRDGAEVGRVSGAVPRAQIETAIQRFFR